MPVQNQLLCFPKEDAQKRLLLGKPGSQNLLCIGINPHTAHGKKLDPTSKNVAKIAQNHGYDGWFLMNLYPKRTAKVALLETRADLLLFQENLSYIQTFLEHNDFKIRTIWLAWGNGIASTEHPYLREAAEQLYLISTRLSFNFVSIGINHSGHPTHPSPQALAQKFRKDYTKIRLIPFDFNRYILDIVRT
ncbi:DUF1643 domain-containing protein [Spongiimicrobium salis]|uniref:DUF1643 domain-containing protein n=1 Tax=Spongiimicrobium salis TaxID=1667022 RepID=UPI00374DAEE0